MSPDDPKTREFLDKHFKAGEYSTLTIMVNNSQLNRLIEHLRESGLNLAVMPHVQHAIDFQDDDKDGETH